MMMTKKAMFFGGLLAVLLLTPVAQAALTELPDGYLDGWSGKSSYALNLGGGQYLSGHVEFAVYDTLFAGDIGFAVPGENRYVYVYQIFADTDATAALVYFGVTGFNPDAIGSEDDLGTAAVADGIDPIEKGVNLAKTNAYFEFENGDLISDEKSVFLLIGSDYLPTIGAYEIAPSPDGDIPVPGGNDNGNGNPVPEPATVALLLGGTLMALRKRQL